MQSDSLKAIVAGSLAGVQSVPATLYNLAPRTVVWFWSGRLTSVKDVGWPKLVTAAFVISVAALDCGV